MMVKRVDVKRVEGSSCGGLGDDENGGGGSSTKVAWPFLTGPTLISVI